MGPRLGDAAGLISCVREIAEAFPFKACRTLNAFPGFAFGFDSSAAEDSPEEGVVPRRRRRAAIALTAATKISSGLRKR